MSDKDLKTAREIVNGWRNVNVNYYNQDKLAKELAEALKAAREDGAKYWSQRCNAMNIVLCKRNSDISDLQAKLKSADEKS